MADLYDFIRESNRIEGIHRPTFGSEVAAHEALLELPEIRIPEVTQFVKEVADAPLRDQPGMDVGVGSHRPPPGGPEVREQLEQLLADISRGDAGSPWAAHVAYETLHPFMDGNGRSGRVLWAWMRFREGRDPFALGFLHAAYYEALEESRS